jgi:hypothetical protein
MNYLRVVFKSLTCLMALAIFGCGSGKDVNGSLNVSASKTDSETLTTANFTIVYTNPQKTDVLGVKIDVDSDTDSFSFNMSNSGVKTITYLLPRYDTEYVFRLTARTGDFVSGAAVVVPKLGTTTTTTTLTASPTSLTFAASAPVNSTQTVNISGGTSPYHFVALSPSSNTDISADVSAGTLTVTKLTTNSPGSVNVVVQDNANGVLIIPVAY